MNLFSSILISKICVLPIHRKICGESMENMWRINGNQTLERKRNLPFLHYTENVETDEEVMSLKNLKKKQKY